jgi:hypothetical protein
MKKESTCPSTSDVRFDLNTYQERGIPENDVQNN